MLHANRLGILGLGMATGALVTALTFAQPKAANDEKPKVEDFTAFPKITVPMKQVDRGGKNEDVPDYDRLFARFAAKHPRPIPADAAPLIKVRTAQVNEGVLYLMRMRPRMEIGPFRPEQFAVLVRLAGEVFRIAAELEPAVAGRRGFYEDQVAFFKELERVTGKRVRTGTVPPQELDLARFYRLEAEADLIRFEQSLGGGE